MNFARSKCDERAMQGLMRKGAFALHLGKESCCSGIVIIVRSEMTVESVSHLVGKVDLPRGIAHHRHPGI
jgi:hypothetical protein